MKILHLMDRGDDLAGGTVTAVKSMMTALSLVPEVEDQLVLAGVGADRSSTRLEDANHLTFPTSKFSWSSVGKRMLEESVSNYDVIMVHAIWCWPAQWVGKIANRTILVPHGSLDSRAYSRPQLLAKRAAALTILRGTLTTVEQCWVSSESELDGTSKWISSERCRVIPIPIDVTRLDVASTQPARRARTILFFGRLERVKRLELVIEALSRISSDITLRVAGQGDSKYEAELRDLADSRGVSQRIAWLGWLDDEDRVREMGSASIVAIPSRIENYGLVAAEACLSGAAVLATPGVPLAVAMAGDGGAHIAAGNAADLAHAIDDVIDDSDRRMALVANGRLFLESLSPRGGVGNIPPGTVGRIGDARRGTGSVISIVTISYNQARWLPNMLRSIEINRRDGFSVEHIVVDAGSTDGSRELLESHRSGIDLLILEPDSGPADGLNKGISRATGDVVGYINADDMLLPGAAAAIESVPGGPKSFDLFIGNGVIVDAEDRVIRALKSARRPSLRGIALLNDVVMQQATFFSRCFIGTSPFNVANRIAWDTELLMMTLCKKPRIAYLDADLGAFRVQSDGITGSGDFIGQIKQEHKRLLQEYCGEPWTRRHDIEASLGRVAKGLRSVAQEPSRLLGRITPDVNRRFR